MKIIGYTSDRREWYPEIPGDDVEWETIYTTEMIKQGSIMSPEQWEMIGWVYLADQDHGAPPFVIEPGPVRMSTNSTAAYVKRAAPAPQRVADPMNELTKRLETLEQFAVQTDKALEMLARQLANRRELDNIPPADAMTFYDHAFLAAWSALGESYSEPDAIRHARRIAATLTAARRPVTGA